MDKLANTKQTGLTLAEKEQIVADNTKPALFREVKTVALAVSGNYQSLASMKKQYGEKLPLAVLKVWIINLNDFLNIPRKMTPPQIEETAEMIMDEFYYLKSSDIALVFQRIKTGHYGQLYESIDGMKLMNLFNEYAQERMNHFMDETTRQHNEIKSQE